MKVQNDQSVAAFTVDVEDYFMVSAMEKVVSRDQWASLESRVERNTETILDFLEGHGILATFFVLGWVAERYPGLVRKIAEAGHEIGSHGWSHRLIYEQTPEVFRDETFRARNLLQDLSGQSVPGYRAASYSITKQSLWALDILREAGHRYDSSIVPARHDRYGIPGADRYPHVIKEAESDFPALIEFPPTTWKLGPITLPIGGGGYFRIFPYFFSMMGLQSSLRKSRPIVFYIHPWEIDPDQPRFDPGWKSRFRHYTNLGRTMGRLDRMVRMISFMPAKDVLENALGINLGQEGV
jgi:polysaccharide deacetylase family protein (PEP-CTERM system associated)